MDQPVKAEEPEFVRQSNSDLTIEQREEWIKDVTGRSYMKGLRWPRLTWDDAKQIILIEVWRERPADEGEPRWRKP